RKPENEKKQHRKKREVDPNKPKRQTGLSKPMKLSADLSAFLGQKYCARTDVVKNLWKYIKENNMQDPSDKRYILCDDKLKKLFDTDRLYMYTMNKLLNQHLVK
ncbi:SWIB/MDM2 domain-containing protein, partial [Martensiomyces pterosporus]